MRYLFAFCTLLLLSSCQWFESKGSMTQKLIRQDMESIDWNQVDKFPLYDECDENASKVSQERCFTESVKAHLEQIFKTLTIDHRDALSKLTAIKIAVDTTGSILLEEVIRKEQESDNTFDLLLRDSIGKLPKLYPALKRGLPVRVSCMVPIQIEIEN